MSASVNQTYRKRDAYNFYTLIACATFLVFFSRLAELIPILGKIHINLLLFLFTFGYMFISGAWAASQWTGNKSIAIILACLFIGFVTIPFSVWPGRSLEYWIETLLINNTLIIFYCFAAIHNRKQLLKIIHTFLLSISILVTFLFLDPNITQYGRPYVTNTYDANDLALLFVVSIPIFLSQYWGWGWRGKVLLSGIISFVILAVLKTGSRGGLLALLVGVVFGLFFSKIKIKKLYKVFVLFACGALLLSSQAEQVIGRWGDVISGEDYNVARTDDHGGGRLAIWRSGMDLFRENLLFGVGLGNSSIAMGESYGSTAWITMHNSYIQVALELGILGLFVFLLMLRTVWSNCSQVIERTKNMPHEQHLFTLSASLRISLVVYMVGAFFLSQAYLIIIPFFLILSDRLRYFSSVSNEGEL